MFILLVILLHILIFVIIIIHFLLLSMNWFLLHRFPFTLDVAIFPTISPQNASRRRVFLRGGLFLLSGFEGGFFFCHYWIEFSDSF